MKHYWLLVLALLISVPVPLSAQNRGTDEFNQGNRYFQENFPLQERMPEVLGKLLPWHKSCLSPSSGAVVCQEVAVGWCHGFNFEGFLKWKAVEIYRVSDSVLILDSIDPALKPSDKKQRHLAIIIFGDALTLHIYGNRPVLDSLYGIQWRSLAPFEEHTADWFFSEEWVWSDRKYNSDGGYSRSAGKYEVKINMMMTELAGDQTPASVLQDLRAKAIGINLWLNADSVFAGQPQVLPPPPFGEPLAQTSAAEIEYPEEPEERLGLILAIPVVLFIVLSTINGGR